MIWLLYTSGLDRSTSLVSSIQDHENHESVETVTPTSSTTNSFFGFLSGKSRKNSSTINSQQQQVKFVYYSVYSMSLFWHCRKYLMLSMSIIFGTKNPVLKVTQCFRRFERCRNKKRIQIDEEAQSWHRKNLTPTSRSWNKNWDPCLLPTQRNFTF